MTSDPALPSLFSFVGDRRCRGQHRPQERRNSSSDEYQEQRAGGLYEMDEELEMSRARRDGACRALSAGRHRQPWFASSWSESATVTTQQLPWRKS